jgi:RNA polymerase sigma factor (sigma-70 family)
MDEKPDSQLLREYAEHRSEAAFRELVHRYTDLVYSAALRQVISPDAARDVAQEVFTDLATKAKIIVGKSASEASLAGWLYRSTRFLVLNYLRDERRRIGRERQVMEQTDLTPAAEPEWERIRPVLDEAMSDLSDADRDALLLRFFKNRDFRAIGQSLGLSDDAAQKRVSRALEKLRAEFERRGVTTSAVALSTVLSANAVTVAPAGLATVLSTSALAGTAAAATASVVKTITMTTLQKTVIAATLVVVAGTGIYKVRQASELRDRIQALQQKQELLTEQIQELDRYRDDATRQIVALRDENERLKRNAASFLKQQDRSAGDPTSIHHPPDSVASSTAPNSNENFLARDSWADVGFATPQAALQTRGWTVLNGERARFKESVFITDGARKLVEDMIVKMASASSDPNKEHLIQEALSNQWDVEEAILMPMMALNQQNSFTGYRIVSQRASSADEMIFEVETQMASAPAKMETLKFRRFGNDWKVVIDEDVVRSEH